MWETGTERSRVLEENWVLGIVYVGKKLYVGKNFSYMGELG